MPHESSPSSSAGSPSPRSRHAAQLLEHGELILHDVGLLSSRQDRWREWFGLRIGPSFDGTVVFEIGCNDATFLSEVAARQPRTAFVGLDWKVKAIVDAATRINARGQENVALIRGRAQSLRTIFADGELDAIWVFHPDPCDRDVERPNRLWSDAFLLDAYAVLKPGGRLVLKTDHAEYFCSALEILAGPLFTSRFVTVDQTSDLWNDAAARSRMKDRPFVQVTTPFEDRYRRKRTPIGVIELETRSA